MTDSFVRRFLFETLDIRGAVVRLEDCWQHLQAGRNYPAPVAQLLGEAASVTALIAAQLKQAGRLTLQLRGNGPIRLLVLDCNESLQMRGMARSNPVVLPAPAPTLLGAHEGGQLLLSLDLPTARQPYQSIVPMVGENIAAIFEHYLEHSDQQPSRLFLATGEKATACLFLQKMPDADSRDPDGWHRLTQLAATVRPEELLELPVEELLTRLFHEEMQHHDLRAFDPRPVVYHCPEDWEKVRAMVLSLGKEEAEAILAEHGEIVLRDDICNRDYRFSSEDVASLFAGNSAGHTLH